VTTFFLVRHAAHALLGQVLAGRMPDLSLNLAGRRQASRLGLRLVRERLTLLQSSPSRRARETADLLAAPVGLPVAVAPALDEVDFGEWTGRSFAELSRDPRWRVWNAERGAARAPGGESMEEAQSRIVGHLESLRRDHPDGRILLVTHAEIVRAALLHHLGLPLQAYERIEISPGSVTVLSLGEAGAAITRLNEAAAA
jgi:probable phosphoglycerate mutase